MAALALASLARAQDAQDGGLPAGFLPVPQYGGDWPARAFLTGDWGGRRQDWAEGGVSFDLQWTQHAQGVVHGGLDTGFEYPGSFDAVMRVDLLRSQRWPALLTVRSESRYGDNVNLDTGLILPSNTDVGMPLTEPPDQDLLAAVTELNVLQVLPTGFALVLGKIQTLDADPCEFASGRGRDQFFQFPLVGSSVTALTVPYSTLAGSLIWMPNHRLSVSTTLMNSADSSTTSGFDDVGEGTTWATEARTQHTALGGMPGGTNVGFIYAFDGDFRDLQGKLILSPGGLGTERESASWAIYWTGWQYLSANGPLPDAIDAGDGQPDVEGYGLFARFGVADEDTNPIAWNASIGLGGRGLGSREQDTWGLGCFHNELQEPNTEVLDLLADGSGGVEGFYGIALGAVARLTLDAQWLQSAFGDVDDSVVLGARLNVVL